MAVENVTRVDDLRDGGINSVQLAIAWLRRMVLRPWMVILMVPSSKAVVDNCMK